MNIQDALKIFGLEKTKEEKEIKEIYKTLSKKYHPDLGGSLEMMQALNEAFEILKSNREEASTKNFEYGEKLNRAILFLKALEGVVIELCGAWVWVSGNTKEYRAELKKEGFKWASKKKLWYFRPEDFKSRSRNNFSMGDIRAKYGSKNVYEKESRTRLSNSYAIS